MTTISRSQGNNVQSDIGADFRQAPQVKQAEQRVQQVEASAQRRQEAANAISAKGDPTAGAAAQADAQLGWKEQQAAWDAYNKAMQSAAASAQQGGGSQQGSSGNSGSSQAAPQGAPQGGQGNSSGQPSDSSSQSQGSTGSSASSGSKGVGSTSKLSDGFTVEEAIKEMKNLWKNGSDTPSGQEPSDAQYKEIAQGVFAGVNSFFTGKNGLGDFSNVSPTDTARRLMAMSCQESKFGLAGQDGGGLLQVWPERLQNFNDYAPASLKAQLKPGGGAITDQDLKSDHQLAAQVATWSIAFPTDKPGYKMVEQTAGAGTPYEVPIPKDPLDRMAYFWNFHPEPGHGHDEGELKNYMKVVPGWQNLLTAG